MNSSLTEAAKSGDLNAIESLMNSAFKVRGITAHVKQTGSMLRIVLMGNEVPDRDLADVIKSALIKLQLHHFDRVFLQAQTQSSNQVVWTMQWKLSSPSLDAVPSQVAEQQLGQPSTAFRGKVWRFGKAFILVASLIGVSTVGVNWVTTHQFGARLARSFFEQEGPGDDINALLNQGFELYQQGQYDSALALYDKAISLDADHPIAWMNRGDTLDELGRYSEALAAYNRSIELDPQNATVWSNRGFVLYQQGHHQEALISYTGALDIDPDHTIAWLNRGVALHHLERYDDALAAYSKAAEIEPQNTLIWLNRGNTLDALSQYEAALAAYDQAVELDPENATAWINRGFTLYQVGQYQDALISYNQAVALVPNSAIVWANRGVVLDKLGRLQEARNSYETAIAIDPTYADTYAEVGGGDTAVSATTATTP